jgi:hypothetical protein
MTRIEGRLLVTSGTYSVEFYANAVVNHSGLSEGQWFLGTATATYDPALGYAPITGNFAIPSIPGATLVWNNRPVEDHFISAVAINASGNTSEFSPARDVLRSAVQVTFSGTQIKANFVPESNPILGGKLNLAGAEAVCMVNHFNWLQYVTPPAPWQFFTVHNGVAVLDPGAVPDPVENSPAFGYQLRAAGHPNVVIEIEGPTDAFPFVYNEINEPKSPYNLSDQIKTLPGIGQVLEFDDAPSLPSLVAGFLSFQTSLLGVPSAGGTPKNANDFTQWAGLSSAFRWQSDAKVDAHGNPAGGGVSNVSFMAAVPGRSLGSYKSGGVSGVVFADGSTGSAEDTLGSSLTTSSVPDTADQGGSAVAASLISPPTTSDQSPNSFSPAATTASETSWSSAVDPQAATVASQPTSGLTALSAAGHLRRPRSIQPDILGPIDWDNF